MENITKSTLITAYYNLLIKTKTRIKTSPERYNDLLYINEQDMEQLEVDYSGKKTCIYCDEFYKTTHSYRDLCCVKQGSFHRSSFKKNPVKIPFAAILFSYQTPVKVFDIECINVVYITPGMSRGPAISKIWPFYKIDVYRSTVQLL